MKTVLVVDDVPEVTNLLKVRLEKTQRFSVITANAAKDALRLAAEMRPHIVVTDIDMPGMAGSDLAAALAQKEATKNIPLLFLSSLVTPQDVRNSTRSGKWLVASKQSPIDVIIVMIDQVIGAD